VGVGWYLTDHHHLKEHPMTQPVVKDYDTDTLTKQLSTPYNEVRSLSGDSTIYVDGDLDDHVELVRIHDLSSGSICVEVQSDQGWWPFGDINPDRVTIEEASSIVTRALTYAADRAA
jgi:hypothetical protein